MSINLLLSTTITLYYEDQFTEQIMFLLYTCTLCEFTRSEEKKQAWGFSYQLEWFIEVIREVQVQEDQTWHLGSSRSVEGQTGHLGSSRSVECQTGDLGSSWSVEGQTGHLGSSRSVEGQTGDRGYTRWYIYGG